MLEVIERQATRCFLISQFMLDFLLEFMPHIAKKKNGNSFKRWKFDKDG